MKKLPLLALFLLGGCYATAQPFYLPDGTAGYRISCDNSLGNPTDCLQKAGDLCGPNGYQMYDSNGHLKAEDSQNPAVISTISNAGASSSPAAKSLKMTEAPKNMFIKCRSMDMPGRLTPASNPPTVQSSPVSVPATAQPTPLHSTGK